MYPTVRISSSNISFAFCQYYADSTVQKIGVHFILKSELMSGVQKWDVNVIPRCVCILIDKPMIEILRNNLASLHGYFPQIFRKSTEEN